MQPFDRAAPAPHALLEPGRRGEIERAVSAHLNRPWRVRRWRGLDDRASQPAALLSDGTTGVFAKFSPDALASDRFEQEAFGLRFLAERASVTTPAVLAVVPLGTGAVLLLEALPLVPRPAAPQWRRLGRALAHLHEVRGPRFGLDRPGYWGSLPQDNTPADSWMTFYLERRVWPRLAAAVDSGHLPPDLARRVEALAARGPDLGVPDVGPRLLHGDAHRNNLLLTTRGPVFIDPSVHYGHPEYDLAYVDFFAPVPTALLDGYREVRGVAPGFGDRRGWWRLHAWLVMISLGDTSYLADVATTARRWA